MTEIFINPYKMTHRRERSGRFALVQHRLNIFFL